MSLEAEKARAMRDLRALAVEAVSGVTGDPDALMRATADGLAAAIDAGDIADAVSGLLEHLVAEQLEDAQAGRLCPDCGGELVDAAYATGDPGDDRLACPDCGRVGAEDDWQRDDSRDYGDVPL